MLRIDQESLTAIQPELTSGERVLWAGAPSTKVVFHSRDAFLIPFSLLWGGFAIFWELGVTGHWGVSATRNSAPTLMVFWGIPFIVIGQYLIWGRFVYAAWIKRRTHYAVTNRRILVVQDGWSRRTVAAYIDAIPVITREGRAERLGSLRFGLPVPVAGGCAFQIALPSEL
jgi:hypothetical protein